MGIGSTPKVLLIVSTLYPAALVALLSIGCTRGAPMASSTKVELDVFSGRVNPSWDLPAKDASELARRLAGLPSVARPPAEPGLGYRGFVISSPDRIVRVYQGVVTVSENGVTHHYRDVGQLESWLAEQARARGHGDLVAGVASPVS